MIRTILIGLTTLLIGAVMGWQARYLFDNDFDYAYARQKQLNEAAGRGDLTGMRRLLSTGANPDAAPICSMGEGSKPLGVASESAQPDAVSLLLEKGAKVNYVDNDAATALDHAEYAKQRAEKTIDILKAHGGKNYHELSPQPKP